MPSSTPKPPKLPHDFIALPLTRPPTKSYPRPATHYLYLKPNAPRIPTATTARELFLANLPVDATPSNLKRLFAHHLGGVRIDSVAFSASLPPERRGIPVRPAPPTGASKKRKIAHFDDDAAGDDRVAADDGSAVQVAGALPDVWDEAVLPAGSSAVARFVDEESAGAAWRAARKVARGAPGVPWEGLERTGAKRYAAHHRLRYPDRGVLRERVDEYMAVFEARERERAKELARRRAEPDEDGFVTVTRGGRNGPAREEDVKVKMEELKAREKNRVSGDFYRFQTREKKKEVAKDLVKSFEEDARRVEEMRKRRGKVRPEN